MSMSAGFQLDHARLAGDPRFAPLASALRAQQATIGSRESFNRYCRAACRHWEEHLPTGVGKTSAQFADLLQRVERGGEAVIRTPWGGVVITRHEHPRVEKFLVVKKGGYLALETHEEKDEHLEVREGAGLMLSRRAAGEALQVEALKPGDRFHFEPGMEHCIIGTEDLLVFERSTDPRGMDQDLVFIYEPDSPPA